MTSMKKQEKNRLLLTNDHFVLINQFFNHLESLLVQENKNMFFTYSFINLTLISKNLPYNNIIQNIVLNNTLANLHCKFYWSKNINEANVDLN